MAVEMLRGPDHMAMRLTGDMIGLRRDRLACSSEVARGGGETPFSSHRFVQIRPIRPTRTRAAPWDETNPNHWQPSSIRSSSGVAFVLLASQDVVVVLRKAMRLVADVLQETQGRGVAAQPDWLGFAGPVDLLLALRQRD